MCLRSVVDMTQSVEMLCRVVVVLWALVGIATASTGSSPLETKPDKYKDVPGCYISVLDKVVPLGQDVTSSNCVLYRCEEKWYDFYTCDIKMTSPDCKLIAGLDHTKPYPGCCPVLRCSE